MEPLGHDVLNFKSQSAYNDASISNASRYSFLDFFYGFNHPIYQEIEYRDLRNKIISPPEICAQLEENITFFNSIHPSRGQGGDFMLEQKVKKQKMLSPKGLIEKLTWQKISRCVDKVGTIYDNTSRFLDLCDENQSRLVLMSGEILEWRTVLRYSRFLEHTDMQNVYDINGNVLNSQISNLSSLLREKRKSYWKMHAGGTKLKRNRIKEYSLLLIETKANRKKTAFLQNPT